MLSRAVVLCGLGGALWAGDIAVAEPSSATSQIVAKLRAEAAARRLPPDVAQAVGYIETGFDPTRIGAAGEIGLMQVMPQTAAMLGFAGTDAELADVDTNIRYGVNYLATAWRLADNDLCRALTKYRAGHGAEFMTAKSIAYCRRARTYLAGLHSSLAEGVLPQAQSEDGKADFWTRHRARVQRLDAKVKARWAALAGSLKSRGRGGQLAEE